VERRNQLELPIAAWSAWAPGLETEQAWAEWAVSRREFSSGIESPKLAFVDPLMRRRLSRLARMALHVGHACLQVASAHRIVLASRHGELQRTVGMLHELTRGGELSPTDFSLSVHNAIAGVHSIVQHDRSPSIAVAAGEESFGYGLLEAAGQWQLNPAQRVLVIFTEEPAPAEYRRFIRAEERPHAVAMLLGTAADTLLRISRDSSPGGNLASEMQSLSCLAAWNRKDSEITWRGQSSVWRWRRTSHAV
jgi:beta-ketoacyl synthase-like protein